jgi:uncharacterized membrane protein YvlD (DUF360 family)
VRSLFLHWILNAAALWVAAAIVPGLDFSGGPGRLLLVAAVFGIVNSTLRPLLTILTCPLIVLTLGFFSLVLNALIYRERLLGRVLRRTGGRVGEYAAVAGSEREEILSRQSSVVEWRASVILEFQSERTSRSTTDD